MRPVQLQHRVPSRPPDPAAGGHLEDLVNELVWWSLVLICCVGLVAAWDIRNPR